MKNRGLSERDVLSVSKTYTQTIMKDEYYVISSGGQSGQILVYGISSMRILINIGVIPR